MWKVAANLAYRHVLHQRMKSITAILGVAFACILVFTQIGFRDSLFRTAASFPRNLKGDLFVLHPLTEAIWRGVSFPKRDVMRLYGHPAVQRVDPFYMGFASWQNPETREKNTILVLGYDLHVPLLKGQDLNRLAPLLSSQDTLAFDRLSRPEFGPVEPLLHQGELTVELNDRKEKVLGTFAMGTSFAASGNVVMDDNNFLRLFPHRTRERIDIGVITLVPGASVEATKTELLPFLESNLALFTSEELALKEEDYWKQRTAIGFMFGMGVLMGLVVGMVIVYQILFTDVMNHLHEYATLRTIGYSQRACATIVLFQALFLAILGFFPGLFLSFGIYSLTEKATMLPMELPFKTICSVFCLIIGMCTSSGLLAIQKLKLANPADLF
jgi:putative ABC transport system permease protein